MSIDDRRFLHYLLPDGGEEEGRGRGVWGCDGPGCVGVSGIVDVSSSLALKFLNMVYRQEQRSAF